MDVYVMKEGRRKGPYQPFLLKEMLEDGELTPLDSVWHEGMEKWQPLGETDSLRSVFKKSGSPPVEERPEDWPVPKTAPVKPAALSLEQTLAVLRQRRALGWRRFFARQMDITVAVVAVVMAASALEWTDMWALISPTSWTIVLAPGLLWIPVEAVMLATLGWTPGRLILGLRVVDVEGSRPGLRSASKRSVLVWAGGLGFGLPANLLLPLAQWLYSFWHFQRYGGTLWDNSAGTRVISSEFHRGHAVGLAIYTAVVASITAWMVFQVPLPSRFTGEERSVIEPWQQAVWEVAEPAPVPTRNSGLPSRPGA